MEKDGALERRFQPVQVGEPTVAHTIEILKGLRARYEAHHRVSIPADALVAAALARDESRGGHYREDHPLRDDEHWLKHSLAWLDGECRERFGAAFVDAYDPQRRALLDRLTDYLRGRIAAFDRWARTADRTAATAPARAGLDARFEREVDPAGELDPAERTRRADAARKAHFARLALRSAQSRRQAAAARQAAAERKSAAAARQAADELQRAAAELQRDADELDSAQA